MGTILLAEKGGEIAPLIAIIGVVLTLIGATIAYQQFVTARDKLRLDLFDRRYLVYRSVIHLMDLTSQDTVTPEHIATYQFETHPKWFLFGEEIGNYVDSVRQKASTTITKRNLARTGRATEPELDAAFEEAEAISRWMSAQVQHGHVRRLFAPYLDFSRVQVTSPGSAPDI